MNTIDISSHPVIVKFIDKIEKNIVEKEADYLVLNLRKIVEYMCDQYLNANSNLADSDIAYMDLKNKTKLLFSNNIISENVCSTFTAIRKTGNTDGAHWNRDDASLKLAITHYESLKDIMPIFLTDIPYEIESGVTLRDRMDVDLSRISPVKITGDISQIDNYYSEMWHYFSLVDNALKYPFELQPNENVVINTLRNYIIENYVIPIPYFVYGVDFDVLSTYDFWGDVIPHVVERTLKPVPKISNSKYILKDSSDCYIDLPQMANNIISQYRKLKNKKDINDSSKRIIIPTLLKDFFNCEEIFFDKYGNPSFVDLKPSFPREYILAQCLFTPEVIEYPSHCKELVYFPDKVSVRDYQPNPNVKMDFYAALYGVNPEIVTLQVNAKKIIVPSVKNIEYLAELIHNISSIEEIVLLGENNKYKIKSGFLISDDEETLYYALDNADPCEYPMTIKNLGPYAHASYIINVFEYHVPSTLCRIEKCAYKNLASRYVFMPESLSYVGEGAFTDCKDLVYIICENKDTLNIDQKAVINCKNFEGIISQEEYKEMTSDNTPEHQLFFKNITATISDNKSKENEVNYAEINGKTSYVYFIDELSCYLNDEIIKMKESINILQSSSDIKLKQKLKLQRKIYSMMDYDLNKAIVYMKTHGDDAQRLKEIRAKYGFLTNYEDPQHAVLQNTKENVQRRRKYYLLIDDLRDYLKNVNKYKHKDALTDENILSWLPFSAFMLDEQGYIENLVDIRNKYGLQTNFTDDMGTEPVDYVEGRTNIGEIQGDTSLSSSRIESKKNEEKTSAFSVLRKIFK